jgi:hypothetical protein
VDVAEDDEYPVVGRQDAHEEVPHGDGIRWIRSVVVAPPEAVESRTSPTKPAQRQECTVASDSEEPCTRILDRRQLGTMLDRDEQGLLQDVLGERAIPHDLGEKPTERLLGRLKQRLQVAGFVCRGPSIESSVCLHVSTFPRGRLL